MPDPKSGYTTDDNARALIVALKHHRLFGNSESLEGARRYLAFLRYAQNREGKFHNFLSYNREWQDWEGSQDCQGRAVWALGYAAARAPEQGMREAASRMLSETFVWVDQLAPPRARANAILGLAEVADHPTLGEAAQRSLRTLADGLVALYERTATPDWRWFELGLTYDNGRMPEALLSAYQVTGEATYREVALESLDFLLEVLFPDGVLDLIGNDGWYHRGGRRAYFDQQPIDAEGTVAVCLRAHAVTGEARYRELAERAFQWFLGRNRVGVPLYDAETGGCYDGLHPHGVNGNQGAESTLAYLLARLALEEQTRIEAHDGRKDPYEAAPSPAEPDPDAEAVPLVGESDDVQRSRRNGA